MKMCKIGVNHLKQPPAPATANGCIAFYSLPTVQYEGASRIKGFLFTHLLKKNYLLFSGNI